MTDFQDAIDAAFGPSLETGIAADEPAVSIESVYPLFADETTATLEPLQSENAFVHFAIDTNGEPKLFFDGLKYSRQKLVDSLRECLARWDAEPARVHAFKSEVARAFHLSMNDFDSQDIDDMFKTADSTVAAAILSADASGNTYENFVSVASPLVASSRVDSELPKEAQKWLTYYEED